MAQTVKNLAAMQKTLVRSRGWEDPLKKEMATHSSILAWRIPWTEEPGGLYSVGSQRVVHDWATEAFFFFQPSCWSAFTGWGPSVACFTAFIRCPSWTTLPTELTCFQSESYSRYHGAIQLLPGWGRCNCFAHRHRSQGPSGGLACEVAVFDFCRSTNKHLKLNKPVSHGRFRLL